MKLKQDNAKYRALLVSAAMLLTFADAADGQGYGGPSMLSRGGNRPGQRGRAPVDLVAYGGIRGFADSGLTGVRVNEAGNLEKQTRYGVQAEIGAYGTHSWSKTILGLDYRGDYRKTTRGRSFSGTNQALSIDLQHLVTRRLQLVFRETGGTTNRAFGGFASPAITDLDDLGIANDEVFDTRVYFSQTTGAVAYQRSARTAYIASGDVFFVKRPSNALVSVTGYRALGAYQYRLSRRNTVSGIYSYMKFNYNRVFGGTDIHGLGLRLERRASPNLTLRLTAGAYYLEAFGTQRVTLSPEVSAILGRPTGIEAFHRRRVIPQVEASATYALERSSMRVGYISGVSPGNGVYLTSQRQALSAGYSFTGIRKLSLGLSTSYSILSSKSLSVGELKTFRVGGGFNYSLARHLNLSSQADYRTYDSPAINGREGFSVTLGFTVSPSRIPLSIW
jgi:hypothetical protein